MKIYLSCLLMWLSTSAMSEQLNLSHTKSSALITTATMIQAHAGFREITVDGATIGVWYPSDSPATAQRLGPFDVNMARNAPIKSGKYDIVLLSHGYTGRYRNHYLTAQQLAEAGLVVIAPNHAADVLIGGYQTAQALNHRYQELQMALKAVTENKTFAHHVNAQKVHGIGYSLGGATILLASGAEYSTERISQYCQQYAQEDVEFCQQPGWVVRILQALKNKKDLPEVSEPFRNQPIVNGKVVLVAPVSRGLDIATLAPVESLIIFAIDGDSIAKPELHARRIIEMLPKGVPYDYQTIPGHHYAFIAPFPKWLTDKEDIPVAKDPEGFDRLAFLEEINNKILIALLSLHDK